MMDNNLIKYNEAFDFTKDKRNGERKIKKKIKFHQVFLES